MPGQTVPIDIDQQLQQVVLFSELGSDSENLEQLGPIIKTIYETGRQDEFLGQLAAFVGNKETEIEKMCNANYQEFVHAVDQLLKVRQGTVSLKNRIAELDEDIQLSGKKLAHRKKDLYETRRVASNVDDALDNLQQCLKVLKLSNRVTNQIETKKYYSALRTLEELQNVYLKQINQYDFAKHMQDSIPAMQNSVKEAVTSEMKEWLLNVRNASRTVGQLALEQMAERQERWRSFSNRDPKLRLKKVNSAIEMVVDEVNEFDVVDNTEVKIDFRPLYQCLHIYDKLDKREELQQSYKDDRSAQATLVLSTSTLFKDGDVSTLETLLADMVGFFIIESEIVRTTENFRSAQDVDDICDNMCNRIVQLVSDGLKDSTDPDVYLNAKFSLLTFVQTMEGYGYSTQPLTNLLLTLFMRYSDLLQNKFSEDFHQIVQQDDYMPMVVNDRDEYEKVISVCWFREETRRNEKYPRSLPFSQAYPLCCIDIQNFVNQYYRFADGFAQHHNDVDDILKNSLDELLIEHVNRVLFQKLTSSNNLSQIAQIIINLEHFENACSELERLLVEVRISTHRAGHLLKLKATDQFRESRKSAERRIFEVVNAKIDDFLELADVEWTPRQPRGHPSMYLQEMVGYLSTVINSTLLNLPLAIRSFIYFEPLDHLATSLLDEMLLSKEIPRMSEAALADWDVDVQFLEEFVDSLQDNNIADMFLELRQTIDLMRAENVEEYLNPSVRNRKYSRVRPAAVVGLAEKLLHFEAPGAHVDPYQRARRRSLDNVVRALTGRT